MDGLGYRVGSVKQYPIAGVLYWSLTFYIMNPFEQHIAGDKPVVVDFFAEWCAPCKMMPPILKQVKETVGDKVTILKMDVDKNQQYAQKMGDTIHSYAHDL